MSTTSDAEQDLSTSLTALSGLLTSSQSLEATLRQVARLAAHATPGADGAGLVLGTGERPDTVVSGDDFVERVDRVQYELGEGPCITALRDRVVMRSGSLGGDDRWPRFGPRIGRLGVHSALSVPLLLPDEVVGVLNLYAHAKDAFDATSERMLALFAEPAAVSVHHARVLAESQRLAEQLSEALATRATIERAVGIVMAQSGSSPPEAFERLRAISQREKVKLADVAARLVDDAVRRARARSSRRSVG